MTEAPRSTRANRLVNCASTFLITGGRLAARSSLGPSAASRDAAAAAVRPLGGAFQRAEDLRRRPGGDAARGGRAWGEIRSVRAGNWRRRVRRHV